MQNQPTDLQKQEKKDSFAKKTAIDTTSKTFSTGIVEIGKWAIPFLPALVSLVAGLSFYLYIPLGIFACFLLALLWLFRQNKRLKEEVELLKTNLENQSVEIPVKQEKPAKKQPVIICTKTKIDNVIYDKSKVKHPHTTRDSYTTYKDSKALIIEFFNKPLANVESIGELKSIIKFFDQNDNELATIKEGIWMERYQDNSRFDQGDYLELSIALLENDTLYLLERDRLENPKVDRFSSWDRYDYNFRRFNENSLIITVDLIAKDFGRNIIASPKTFKFNLKIKPKFEFYEIKSRKSKPSISS